MKSQEKKILMLINFFPPAAGGGVYRPLSFVKHLSRLSWKITVVTPRPGEAWVSDTGLLKEVPESVRVIRTPSLSGLKILSGFKKDRPPGGSRRSSSAFAGLRRWGEFFLLPDTYVGWAPFASRAAARLCREEKFDVIYSTSPPDSTHLAAGSIARRFALPWVADFRDPWIFLYLRQPPTPLHGWIHRRMESRVAGADRVIVTTGWQKKNLQRLYPGCRVVKISNGYEEEDFKDRVEPDMSAPFTILHAGMLTLGRTAEFFLKGLDIFIRRSPDARGDIRVQFLGARESRNDRWVDKLGLGRLVEF
ncbi:MAG: glycosyltransferase, partial [Candidatus Krumholzibacteriota bacterium]|nr:glycosyltransferase [Candidatus Krumholzibacteriota bacterium]